VPAFEAAVSIRFELSTSVARLTAPLSGATLTGGSGRDVINSTARVLADASTPAPLRRL
jgi:hypothetical protein